MVTKNKNCLNPKCNKEFTPKNKKGVYCSSNCRANHAYQLKSNGDIKTTKTWDFQNFSFGVVWIEPDGTVRAATAEEIAAANKTKQSSNTEQKNQPHYEIGETYAIDDNNSVKTHLVVDGTTQIQSEETKRRITELEKELKNPPKTAHIGVKNWIRVRQQELNKLKNEV